MYERFQKNLQKTRMDLLLQKAGGVLTAYSGGADSTLLLHFLHRYCGGRNIPLYAAHVNHMIRGGEADRDEEHCRQTALALGIPFYSVKIDIPALAGQRSMGIEACAREERYRFFDSLCEKLSPGEGKILIATAHNADDQLETVLFHMMRGTGLRGMTGIPSVRSERYIRPLLPFSGGEIRQFCHDEGYVFTEDSTNADTAYTRNYIRHVITPALRQLNPSPEKAVTRMTELLTRDSDCLEAMAGAWLRDHPDLPGRELAELPQAISARVIRQAFEKTGSPESMTMEQTDSILAHLNHTDGVTRRLPLPGGMSAEITGGAVRFVTEKSPVSALPEPVTIPPLSPGESRIICWQNTKIVLSRKNLPENIEKLENIYKLSIQQPISFAKIKGVFSFRTRLPGDTIRYGGMTRKLKKLLADAHIPPETRRSLPVLADGEGILWVPGFPVCDRVKPAANETDLLWILHFEKE